jgi:hypothetical protein
MLDLNQGGQGADRVARRFSIFGLKENLLQNLLNLFYRAIGCASTDNSYL